MTTRARLLVLAAGVFGAGCAAILGIDDGTPRDGAAPSDASDGAVSDAGKDGGVVGADAGDGSVAMCDVDAAFTPPLAFSTLDTPQADAHLRLAPNELFAYFQSARDGGLGSSDIYTAQRTSIGDTWSGVTALTTINSVGADTDPAISADQLTIFLSHSAQITRAARASTSSAFGVPLTVTELSSAASDFAPYLVEDGSAIYFSSTRNSDAGVSELFVAQPLADGGFTAPANVGGAGLKTGDNRYATVTADQLVMYFASNRSPGQGGFDIWMSMRASTSSAFSAPRVVAELNGATNEFPDWVSPDRCRLYFTSDRGTGADQNVFVATKVP